jgi:hypothetical protein
MFKVIETGVFQKIELHTMILKLLLHRIGECYLCKVKTFEMLVSHLNWYTADKNLIE